MQTVLFIHGFGSNGDCANSKAVEKILNECDVISPTFPPQPLLATKKIRKIIKQNHNDICLIGCNLGAFYAAYCSIIMGVNCVLINPIYDGCEFLRKAKGTHYNIINKKTTTITNQDLEDIEFMENIINSYKLENASVALSPDDIYFEENNKFFKKHGADVIYYDDCMNMTDVMLQVKPYIKNIVQN